MSEKETSHHVKKKKVRSLVEAPNTLAELIDCQQNSGMFKLLVHFQLLPAFVQHETREDTASSNWLFCNFL